MTGPQTQKLQGASKSHATILGLPFASRLHPKEDTKGKKGEQRKA